MKKLLALFLALLMVLPVLAACGPKDDPEKDDPVASSTENKKPDNPNDESTKEELGNLDPSIDLGDKEIQIISRSHPWYDCEVSVESTDGNPIPDSIFQRNLDVESRLHCKIVNTKANEATDYDYGVVNTIKNTMGANDCPYQIMATSAYTAFENTANGICQDLLGVGNLDLSQNYWTPYFNEEASIGNRQYFATGSISLSLRRFVFVTFFNKKLAEQYKIEDLYTVVKEKRWTLDYQAQIIQNMFNELDDVEGATEGDFYGLVTNSHICVDPYWTAGDAKILVKDSDDYFVLEPEIEKLDNILAKVKDIYFGGAAFVYEGESGDVDQNKIRAKFTNSQATMATLRLLEVEAEDFRNMSDAYGIIPMPKYDEAQEEYFSHAHDQFCVYGIVGSVPATEIDDIGAVLECMAIEGQKTVTPAYFEMALKGKYAKDPESWDMLDLIINNIKLNAGVLYTIKINDVVQILRNTLENQNSSIAANVFSGPKLKLLNSLLRKFTTEVKNFQEQ